jgi:phosphatidylglycerophosphate synthase
MEVDLLRHHAATVHVHGRKIPRELENPLDNIFIDAAHLLNTAVFRPLGATPNFITTLSLVVCAASLAAFHVRWYLTFSLLFLVAYVLDCADGNYARMYGMVTDFGDAYDHASDILKVVALVLVLAVHDVSAGTKLAVMASLALLAVLMLVHFGCQQRMYTGMVSAKDGQSFLSPTRKMCPDTSLIRLTRFVGSGTFFTFAALCAAYFRYSSSAAAARTRAK